MLEVQEDARSAGECWKQRRMLEGSENVNDRRRQEKGRKMLKDQKMLEREKLKSRMTLGRFGRRGAGWSDVLNDWEMLGQRPQNVGNSGVTMGVQQPRRA